MLCDVVVAFGKVDWGLYSLLVMLFSALVSDIKSENDTASALCQSHAIIGQLTKHLTQNHQSHTGVSLYSN